MSLTSGLSFAYSQKSLFNRDEDYWGGIINHLKPEFPSLSLRKISNPEEDHHSILIASYEEILGETSLKSPRGLIVTFNGDISDENIAHIKRIYGKSLLGFIDVKQSSELHIPWFKRIVLESKILGTGGEAGAGQVHLGKILEQSLLELQRVKKLHEKVVPIRHEKIKAVNLFSKFAAGFSSGGEFFDLKKGERNLVIIVTHAESYVASSIVLSHFEQLSRPDQVDKEKMEDFLEELINECRELDLIDRDEPGTLQLDIIRLDLRTFHYEGYHFGHGAYFSNGEKLSNENERALNENFFEEAHYEGTLHRGQKLIFASPGVIKNFEDRNEKGLLFKIVKEQFGNGPREILNEIFFQLKKNTEEDFLKYDASVLYLEVDPHAFMQV